MEEIDISQLFNYFKSKIIYILFAMSIAFCVSSIYVNRFRVPEYTSYTTILLNQANENPINAADINLNNSLISTYSEIIKSKKVMSQVIDDLTLEYTTSELSGKVTVSEIPDTTIIKISVTDEDSELACDIANTIATVFNKEIVEYYKIENVRIIDEAEVSKVPSSASALKIIGIFTLAGAFISVVVIFVVFYFDTTIKNEEEIEKITGLPVIGIVPSSREKIKYSQHRKFYDDLAKKHRAQEILPVQKEFKKLDITDDDKEHEISMKVSVFEVDDNTKKEIKEEVNTIKNKSSNSHRVKSSKSGNKNNYKRKVNYKK